MKHIIRLLALSIFLISFHAQADKIEIEIKGQKQTVEFNPNDKADMDRALAIWSKADNQTTYVYFETGIVKVFDEPRDDAKFIEIGTWYLELNSLHQQSPNFTRLTWDKSKWHPRHYFASRGWIKLDDPNLIHPDQLKPVKEWPIRYFAHYSGTDTTVIVPKYDEYSRKQFDRQGYLLDNRTMKRVKTSDGWLRRMFFFRDFVHLTPVWPYAVDVPIFKEGGPALGFNLKQALAAPSSLSDMT